MSERESLEKFLDKCKRLVADAEVRSAELERLLGNGETEAATVIPPGVRKCRCAKCGCDPGKGFSYLVGWSCLLGAECPFGRPEPGVTVAEALGMRTEPVDG